MTREEILKRFDERFRALIEEAQQDPTLCGTGVTAARIAIIQERNELLQKHGYEVPAASGDPFTGFENAIH